MDKSAIEKPAQSFVFDLVSKLLTEQLRIKGSKCKVEERLSVVRGGSEGDVRCFIN